MGTATPGGRRSLEVEAAAEALASRRGSSGSSKHSDSVPRVAKVEQKKIVGNSETHGNVSAQPDRSSGNASPHADIEYVAYPSFTFGWF